VDYGAPRHRDGTGDLASAPPSHRRRQRPL